jgi:hypothetical protein
MTSHPGPGVAATGGSPTFTVIVFSMGRARQVTGSCTGTLVLTTGSGPVTVGTEAVMAVVKIETITARVRVC